MANSSAAGLTPSLPRDTEADSAAKVAIDAARGALNQRLMDSLLHDVRNPLNAFSINLDVLTEKIRREHGEIPAAQEKNLRVMREQIFRMDGILKHFAEFMGAPRQVGLHSSGAVDLSAALADVVTLLGHESRRAMIKVRQMVEPGLKVSAGLDDLRFLAMQAVYRALSRAGTEGEVDVTLQRDGERALLRVKDGHPDAFFEPFPHAPDALRAVAERAGAEVRIAGAETVITLPLS